MSLEDWYDDYKKEHLKVYTTYFEVAKAAWHEQQKKIDILSDELKACEYVIEKLQPAVSKAAIGGHCYKKDI